VIQPFFELAADDPDEAKRCPRLREARIEGDGSPERGLGITQPPEATERLAETPPGPRVLRCRVHMVARHALGLDPVDRFRNGRDGYTGLLPPRVRVNGRWSPVTVVWLLES
jgi:hypothetical protein